MSGTPAAQGLTVAGSAPIRFRKVDGFQWPTFSLSVAECGAGRGTCCLSPLPVETRAFLASQRRPFYKAIQPRASEYRPKYPPQQLRRRSVHQVSRERIRQRLRRGLIDRWAQPKSRHCHQIGPGKQRRPKSGPKALAHCIRILGQAAVQAAQQCAEALMHHRPRLFLFVQTQMPTASRRRNQRVGRLHGGVRLWLLRTAPLLRL